MLKSPNKFGSWGKLVLLAIIWGSSFILMKKGMEASDGTPLYSWSQVAALRVFIASFVLLPFAIRYRSLLADKWVYFLIVGLVGNTIPAFLFTKAETFISSSLAGMLNSLTPLFTVVIGVLFFSLKIQRINVVGILIAMVGAIGLILAKDSEVNGDVVYSLLIVVATMCYGLSVNVIKSKLQGVNTFAITSIALSMVGLPCLIYLITTDVVEVATEHKEGFFGLGYISVLAIVGTAMALVIFNDLVAKTNPVFASTVTYLIPVVAIVLGLIAGEKLENEYLLWMGIVLAGVYLVNKKKR